MESLFIYNKKNSKSDHIEYRHFLGHVWFFDTYTLWVIISNVIKPYPWKATLCYSNSVELRNCYPYWSKWIFRYNGMEKLQIQSGRKASILTLDRSARHPNSNGVNETPIRVWTMKLWQKEFALVPLKMRHFLLKMALSL